MVVTIYKKYETLTSYFNIFRTNTMFRRWTNCKNPSIIIIHVINYEKKLITNSRFISSDLLITLQLQNFYYHQQL